MNWLRRAVLRMATAVVGLHPRDPALVRLFGWDLNTASGKVVTPATAMQVTAVYACVQVISQAVAQLPLLVYRLAENGDKHRDPAHPLYELLHWQPNRWQTSFEFREMMAGHVCLRGNAYAEVVASGGRAVSELVPLHPDQVRPFWAPDGTVAYEHTPTDGRPRRVLLAGEVHHWRGLAFDGLVGMSPITLHRETIGAAMAAREHGARFFGNGARPGGVLKHPKQLSDVARKNMVESWEAAHGGVGRAHRVAVLEEGLEWQSIGMTNEDAQFLETMRYDVSDIARIWRVPPHMIGDLERSTNNNIEHQGIEFVTYTLMPWLVRIEQAIRRDLLLDSWRRTHAVEFLVDGLLRGDAKTRNAAYVAGRQWGWWSANDVRRKENENSIPGGDVYLSPVNMAPSDQLGKPSDEDESTDEGGEGDADPKAA